ncbi:MAG: alanine dehydrogenase [Bacteroidota bacterium]|nr:alanine dehydrogenase [Bacteroidota bacterium]
MSKKQGFIRFSENHYLMPKEELWIKEKSQSSITIGVLKDRTVDENRVAIIPTAVELLVKSGCTVFVECNAGEEANFSDHDYAECGARIKNDTAEIYQADIILKVAPPTMEEIGLMKSKQIIFSSLRWKEKSAEYYRTLIKKKITAFSFEKIENDEGSFPIVRSMSEIAGNASLLIAGEYLRNTKSGMGSLIGGFSGVPSTEVVIIGAGTVGEYAVRSAIGMGASVKVFDSSIRRLRRLQELVHQRIYTSVINPKELANALKTADVAIGALRPVDGVSPQVVTEEMVAGMKEGAIIIDISIDYGGCFETSRMTTHKDPILRKYNVTHYCVPNLPSRVPRTASIALSNILYPILLSIIEAGGINEELLNNYGLRQGVYLYKGILTDMNISERFDLSYSDIELLIVAFLE